MATELHGPTLASVEGQRTFLDTLQRLHEATPLPDPTQVASVSVSGTYGGLEPPDAAGVVVGCRFVPASRVPKGHRAFVQRHVDRAVKLLRIPPIEVRWFRHAGKGKTDFTTVNTRPDEILGGICFSHVPGVIYLNADVRGEAVVSTLAHECRHSVQLRLLNYLGEHRNREADADAFAREYVLAVRQAEREDSAA